MGWATPFSLRNSPPQPTVVDTTSVWPWSTTTQGSSASCPTAPAGEAGAGRSRRGMTDMQALVHDPSCPLDLAEVISAAGLVGWSFDHLVSFQAPRTSPVRVGQTWIVELAGGSALLCSAGQGRPAEKRE